MDVQRIGDLELRLDVRGASRYVKVNAPVRVGRYAELRTPGHVFHCGLDGAVKFVRGRDESWPHPADWLKRTAGGDWVYYSVADYRDVFTLLGEYYLPCLPYASNALLREEPFARAAVRAAIAAAARLPRLAAAARAATRDPAAAEFLERVAAHGGPRRRRRARRLHEVLRAELPVLPPDARHVDYDVLPVVVADGCRHRCAFCAVRAGDAFRVRPAADVARQLAGIRALVGRDLPNFGGCFLAQHDALGAGAAALEHAARGAHEAFGLGRSHVGEPRLFLFGSARSLLEADDALFAMLDRLPFRTWVNVGLESADAETLAALGKPLAPADVAAAFARMQAVNRARPNLELTANFVLGERLPAGHEPALVALCAGGRVAPDGKGTLYLSPLADEACRDDETRRGLRLRFRALAPRLGRPAYLYLIQRL